MRGAGGCARGTGWNAHCAEVTERLCVQPAIAKRAVTRILAKLGYRDRVQLAVAWVKSGM